MSVTALAGGVSSDLVDPEDGIPSSEDDLGVSTYVQMMAAAIAGRSTKLPLSIGLFGEWGSGKSYFMGLLRDQVNVLQRSGGSAYYADIVQIGFNAWSYADANLWASLGDEIFRSLAAPPDDEQAELEADRVRREELQAWLKQSQGQVTELKAAKDDAARKVADLRDDLERERNRRSASMVELLTATASAVKSDENVRADLRTLWRRLGITDTAEQASLLASSVQGAGKDLESLRRTARSGLRYVLIAVMVVGVIALAMAGSGAISGWLAWPSLAVALTGLGGLVAVVRRVADSVHSLVAIADGIRRGEAAGKDRKVDAALKRLQEADVREQVLQAQLDQMVARVAELTRELADLSPGQRLYTFLAERAASDDYRRHLGLIATIRRDFTELAKLQRAWRADSTGNSPRPIDRIVLYIDDLDRCTPQQVVEVLQAVHLLLALDLFVVVVGVDPRWLLHSLRDQYSSLLTLSSAAGPGTAGASEEAAETLGDDKRLMVSTPQDYLEKIFNVPFVLPGMTPTGFHTMLRRLSQPESPPTPASVSEPTHAGTPDLGAAADPTQSALSGEPPSDPRAEDALVHDHLQIAEGSQLDTADHDTVEFLPLQDAELELLGSMAPLVRSPREAKRLLNLYRMLRSTQALSDASRFLGQEDGHGEYQAVGLLLGLLSANPRLLGQLLFAQPDPEQGLLGGACLRTGLAFRTSVMVFLPPPGYGPMWW